MNLLLQIKRKLLLRRYGDSELIRGLLEGIDLRTPIEEANFTVFDTETTGLDVKSSEIVSIGALRIEGMSLRLSTAFHRFIRPENLRRESVEIHGITLEDLERKGETAQKVIEDFLDYVKGSLLVGFNVEFDRRMVSRYTLRLFGVPFITYRVDVFHLWKRRGGQEKSLREIAEDMGIPTEGAHSALDDAYITALVFLKLVSNMREDPLSRLPILL